MHAVSAHGRIFLPVYLLCIQAAAVQENPAFFVPPDAAFSAAPPAGRLWLLHPTAVPSVTSCAEGEKNRFDFKCI